MGIIAQVVQTALATDQPGPVPPSGRMSHGRSLTIAASSQVLARVDATITPDSTTAGETEFALKIGGTYYELGGRTAENARADSFR